MGCGLYPQVCRVTLTREVKGQIKGQGSVYSLHTVSTPSPWLMTEPDQSIQGVYII